MISDSQKQSLKKIVTELQKNSIEFQITGGLAAILYGSKRPLYDIDIDVSKKDIARVIGLFRHNIVNDFDHLSDGMFDLYLLTMNMKGVLIDVSQIEDAYVFNKAGQKIKMNTDISKMNYIAWEGLYLPVQDKQDLIAYKKILGRDTDLTDIEQINKI